MKNALKRFLLVALLVVFFVLIIKPVERNAFNFPLRDEEDNIITGRWVFQGKKLYKDIFFQRQPIPTILSGSVQKLTKPNTIYLLIKRHRDFILFYSFFFAVFLTIRFGLSAFIAIITLELTKFTLLGNLFHAESLLIYPLIYVLGILYSRYKSKKMPFYDIIALSLLLPYIIFTREHFIIFAAFAFLIIYRKLPTSKKRQLLAASFSGFLLLMLLQLPFVSFAGYFKNILPVNFFDFIPAEANYPWYFGITSILFLPIKLLFYPNKDFYLIIKVFSILYIVTLLIFLKQKKYGYFSIAFISLALLSLRPAEFGTFSEGRRFLPWFAALVWLTILNFQTLLNNYKNELYKKLIPLLLLGFLAILIIPYSLREFSLKPDPYNMWYINYSPYFDYGEAIRHLSSPGDSLLAIPQEPLIYWQSQLSSSSPYFFTLKFMYERPRVFQKVRSSFDKNSPDFLFIESSETIKTLMNKELESYVPILKDNKESYLLVRKDKVLKISDEKWQSVQPYGFSKPEVSEEK